MVYRQSRISFAGLLIIGLFVIVQLALVWNGGMNEVFNSPDANANYHFALRILEGKDFAVALPLDDSFARDYLFTRSTRVTQGSLVPTGFLGLIVLYGLTSKLFFLNVIPYLTILIAGAALYYFYRLNELFSNRAGLFALLLLMIHPAWWYYTNDSLLPNVLFVSLLIISVYFFAVIIQRPTSLSYVAAFTALTLALYVRTSEAIWLVPILVAYAVVFRKRINMRWFTLSLLGMAGAAVTIFTFHRSIIPSDFPFGYTLPQNSQGFFISLLPFGFHPRLMLLNAWNYLIVFFWPYTLAVLIAAAVSIKEFRRVRSNFAVWSFLFASCVLLTFYGSWLVVDSTYTRGVTIGTSYVRYFLPIYVFSIPLIAYAWSKLAYLPARRYRAASGVLILLFMLFSYRVTMSGSPETILAKQKTLKTYDAVASWVRSDLPQDAIIVAEKSDKYIWPHRLVITSYESGASRRALAHYLGKGTRLYYVGPTKDERKKAEINETWRPFRFALEEKIFTQADISVYRIVSQ